MRKELAIRLANRIAEVAERNKVPSRFLAAIARQESGYNLKAQNFKTHDVCMMQINEKTIQSMKLDKDRLINDLTYCLEAGALVLRELKRSYGRQEPDYWTRYNSPLLEKRAIYRQAVERYL